MSKEKQVRYTNINSYSTLNELGPQTKNVWIACHGLGYLSRYFIKYFEGLNAEENYVIAPQAPSKYYQNRDFRHVGASWLTKEATAQEIENILSYLDAIFDAEKLLPDQHLILFGYSQGVSIVTRWAARRRINCDKVIMHSGGIPKELKRTDFEYLNDRTAVYLVYGNQDQFLDEERISYETGRAKELFEDKLTILPFEGKHEVNTKILATLA